MVRTIFAVILGLIIGMAANMGIVQINLLMYPLPDGVTWTDQAEFVKWVKTLPDPAFILVLVAHLAQSFVGGLTAAFITKKHVMCAAMIVGVLTMILGIINLTMIPVPVWFWIEVPLYLVVAWFAGKLVMKRQGGSLA